MTAISYLIIALNIVLAIIEIPVYIRRIKRTDLVYSKWGFWLFECFAIFFSILHYWTLQSEKQYSDVELLTTVIGCIGLITWLKYVIQFDESGFWIYNLLGQKKRYEYKNVLMIKRKKREYSKPYHRTEHIAVIHLPNKKVSVDRKCENYFEFMEKMAKKYKEVHGHKMINK